MADRPYKVRNQYIYTEVIYYNSQGVEMGREHQNDDSWYDSEPPEELTEDEIEDWS